MNKTADPTHSQVRRGGECGPPTVVSSKCEIMCLFSSATVADVLAGYFYKGEGNDRGRLRQIFPSPTISSTGEGGVEGGIYIIIQTSSSTSTLSSTVINFPLF